MSSIKNSTFLYEKLNQYFINNISLSYISTNHIIIITNNNNLYVFDKYSTYSYAIEISSDDSKIKALIDDMSVKNFFDECVIHIEVNSNCINLLTNNGKLYCCGIPYGLKCNCYLIEELSHKNIINISCGRFHSLALSSDGRVYGWGRNYENQICDNTLQLINRAIEIKLLNREKIRSIFSGYLHSLAVSENGQLYGWGSNDEIRTITKLDSETLSPVLVSDLIISKICCGIDISYLLSNDGIIYILGKDYLLIRKIEMNEKIIDIACDSQTQSLHKIVFCTKYSVYILGTFGNQVINDPLLTEFKSIDEVFMHYLNKNYKPLNHFLTKFRDELTITGKYVNRYKELEFLGRGSFGEVYKVEAYPGTAGNKLIYAIKKIQYNSSMDGDFINELVTCPEIKQIYSNYITCYHEIWVEKNSSRSIEFLDSTLYIEMDYCDMTLYSFIDKIKINNQLFNNNMLTEMGFYITTKIFYQTLKGVQYLHSCKIIHRDLNPCNILIKFDKKAETIVKIADFGLSTIHRRLGQSHSSDVGHYEYCAPEVHYGKPYDTRADIYSLGKVCKVLFSINMNRESSINMNEMLSLQKYENIERIHKKMTEECIASRYQTINEIIKSDQFRALHYCKLPFNSYVKHLLNDLNRESLYYFKIILHITSIERILKIYFENNIKLSFNSSENIFVITNDDIVYEISKNDFYKRLFENPVENDINFTEVIEDLKKEQLCCKNITDVKYMYDDGIALTKDGFVYNWNKKHFKGIIGERITSFSVNYSYAVMLSENHKILSWDMGNDSLSDLNSITKLSNSEKFISISNNTDLLLGLTVLGNVYVISNENTIPVAEYISQEYSIDVKKLFENIIFTKIICGTLHSLLLTNEGIVYAFGSNEFGQLATYNEHKNFNIIKYWEKFVDIGADDNMYSNLSISIALSENENIYVWGKCGQTCFYSPKFTEFESFNHVFNCYFDRDYKCVEKGISVFNN